MNKEREILRHNQVMERINAATTKEEVPDITPSNLSNYLARTIEFDGINLTSQHFANIYKAITDYSTFFCNEVREIFINILRENYPYRTEEEYLRKYIEVCQDLKFNNIVMEINSRYQKLESIKESQELQFHKNTMKEINNCYNVKKLPKVSEAVLVSYFLRSLKNNHGVELPTESFYGITNVLLEELTEEEKLEKIKEVCKTLNPERYDELFIAVILQLKNDLKLSYLIEEIKAKEERIEYIYRHDHEEIMTQVKDARRISHLPKGYSLSTITGYLSSNSMVYSKGNTIPSGEFEQVAKLLMEGKTFESREIINELARIIIDYHPGNVEEAFMLLLNKLSSLPKIYYVAEEVREILKKQKEFEVRGTSNVNVYFVPNSKSPLDAGKFYNCYISRAKNLNLEDILPLKLEDIVPPAMDVDSIEWYVQEYYDPTFKAAGGIILNKDENIGNVNVFQPSDGKIGITPEEKTKYEELETLSQQVKSIIAKKKRETSEFARLQEAFLKSQQETDQELAELEEKIDMLTKGRGR